MTPAASSVRRASGRRPLRPLITRFDPPLHVLWFGNSFVFYNNGLHGHTSYLAEAADTRRDSSEYVARAVTISAGLLPEHRGGFPSMLKSRPWDAVILQGGSMEALDPALSPTFAACVRRFARAIRTAGARPVLFMTWAYADRPEMTARLADFYVRLGNATQSLVVPAGLAFADALKKKPKPALYTDDLKHPSLAGSYLAACAFYGAMYGKSARGVPYEAGLKPSLAAFLQDSAWETVTRFYGW